MAPIMELPSIEFAIHSFGVALFSPNFTMPRFIPFDIKGRCRGCKGDMVELDYVVQPIGVTVFCSRMKEEKFIEFDKKPFMPDDDAIIRIRSRSRAFSMPIKRGSSVLTQSMVNGTNQAVNQNIPEEKTMGQEVDELINQTVIPSVGEIPLPSENNNQ
jgi:hypothetical protein